MNSMFITTCRMIEAVATQSRAPPYLAVTAGPMSHSPLPIEVPSKMAPGPISAMAAPSENGGGAGRSACSQAGRLRVSALMDSLLPSPRQRRHSRPALPACFGSADESLARGTSGAKLRAGLSRSAVHRVDDQVGDVTEDDRGAEPTVEPEPEDE